jgi:hypothetical protein
MHHVFNLKNNRLNNRDFNIDQNNRDFDFFHNRDALPCVGVQAYLFHIIRIRQILCKVFVYLQRPTSILE